MAPVGTNALERPTVAHPQQTRLEAQRSGQELRARRMRLELTKSQLARLAECLPRHVGRAERGELEPNDAAILQRIDAVLLGLEVDLPPAAPSCSCCSGS